MSTTKAKPIRKIPMGPKTLAGSAGAKRQAAVILEVLAGLRGPGEGSKAMGVSLNRYYQLETRGLQGLIAALEPRPRGRWRKPEDEISRLERERERLERELGRSQALVRAAQRSIGIPAPAATDKSKIAGKKGTGKKRRRPQVRARRAIAALRKSAEEPVEKVVSAPTAPQATAAS